MLRPCSSLRDRRFPRSEMPTGGTTGETLAPHLSSSPATTCTPRAHSPLPLSRPERLSPARGTLICGCARVKIPGRALEALTSARVSILVGRRSEPHWSRCLWRWRGRGGAGTMVAVEQCRNTPKTPHNVPQYTTQGPPPRRNLCRQLPAWAGKGGNLPPMVIQLHTLIAIGRGG